MQDVRGRKPVNSASPEPLTRRHSPLLATGVLTGRPMAPPSPSGRGTLPALSNPDPRLRHPRRSAILASARRERGVAEFKDREQLEAWLARHASEVVVVIAARSALRALPLLGRIASDEKHRMDVVLPLLRGVALPWGVANFPQQYQRLWHNANAISIGAARASIAGPRAERLSEVAGWNSEFQDAALCIAEAVSITRVRTH